MQYDKLGKDEMIKEQFLVYHDMDMDIDYRIYL